MIDLISSFLFGGGAPKWNANALTFHNISTQKTNIVLGLQQFLS